MCHKRLTIVVLLTAAVYVPLIYFYIPTLKSSKHRMQILINQVKPSKTYSSGLPISNQTNGPISSKTSFFFDLAHWSKSGEDPDHLNNILTALAIKEPLISANYTGCFSPLQPVHADNCSQYPEAFDKQLRPKAAKVGLIMQFGHDIDTLDIHLHELYDVVDKFFILEWTRSFNPRFMSRKPLFLERIIHQKRFSKVHSKIVHLILDDVTTAEEARKASGNSEYHLEFRQEAERWRKFLAWNSATGFFGDDDIIGFTDVDEIVSRENVHLMKSCKFKNNRPVSVAMWFAYGRLDTAFKTDYPLPGYPYTLIDEIFWPVGLAKSQPAHSPPNRRRRNAENHIRGGMHVTQYGYLPFLMLKYGSVIEPLTMSVQQLAKKALLHYHHSKRNAGATELYVRNLFDDEHKHRVKPLSEVEANQRRGFYSVPQYLTCNSLRFPAWIGMHDTRLD